MRKDTTRRRTLFHQARNDGELVLARYRALRDRQRELHSVPPELTPCGPLPRGARKD